MTNRRLAIVAGLSVVELWILALMVRSVGGANHEPDFAAVHIPPGYPPQTFVGARSTKTLETGPAPHVVVEVEDATLDVRARPGTTVSVAEQAHRSPWVATTNRPWTLDKTADGVRIAQPGGINFVIGSVGHRLTVVVPPGARLDVRKAGTTVVAGLRADLALHTEDGSISVTDQRDGAVHLTTDDGRIELRDVEAPLVDIGSENGRVLLDRVRADRVAISASDGRIDIARSLLRGGKLRSGSGRIRLDIDPTSNVTVNARATAGKVTALPPLTAVSSGDGDAPATIRVGDGSGRLEVDSDDGSITVVAKGE